MCPLSLRNNARHIKVNSAKDSRSSLHTMGKKKEKKEDKSNLIRKFQTALRNDITLDFTTFKYSMHTHCGLQMCACTKYGVMKLFRKLNK